MKTGLADVTDATFAEEVLAADLPVLLKFTADWCPPCHQLSPVLAAIASERAGELKVAELNVDHNPATAAAYGVLSVPTLILFRAGEPVLSLVGARSKQRLLRELDGR
ncbi:thioredoxin family protein [Streptomyces sp. JH002]|uniref:thioredoxin family protein n=1 Tax=Streptomyces sp. JH002 TaxID=2763259 RepID=UPI003D808700